MPAVVLGQPCQCCIACGRGFLSLGAVSKALEERKEWENLRTGQRNDRSYIIEAGDIESMYFHKRPWIWTCFYRAIVHRPHVDYIGISGITQTYLFQTDDDLPHLPRDPQKSRIGLQRVNPEASSCTPFWTADILNPDNNKTARAEQIGYPVHAHCWILVDRVVGFRLVEANLKIFLVSIEKFWAENAGLWCRSPFKYVGYETDSDPGDWPDEIVSNDSDDLSFIPAWENPTIVPKIQKIVEQATRNPHAESCSRRVLSSVLSRIPLDIIIEMVN